VATVQSLLSDLGRLDQEPKPGTEGLREVLANSGTRVVDYADWLRIDTEKQRRGAVNGKPREKITRVSDMLSVLDSVTCQPLDVEQHRELAPWPRPSRCLT